MPASGWGGGTATYVVTKYRSSIEKCQGPRFHKLSNQNSDNIHAYENYNHQHM